MSVSAKHSTQTNEQYTPVEIIERARFVLGRFDLDPASSLVANKRVQATNIFTEEDGEETFKVPWEGRVWMNPPGGTKPILPGAELKSNPALFWEKLVYDWDQGHVHCAIVLGFTLEVLQTTQRSRHPMLKFPLCVPSKRLRFDTPRRARIAVLRQQLEVLIQRPHSDKTHKAKLLISKKLAALNESKARLVPGDMPTHCNVLVLVPPRKACTLGGNRIECAGPFVHRFVKAFSDIGAVRV